MNHLGHKSKAIHATYGRRAQVTTLPIEYYELQKAKKIIEFNQTNQEPGGAEALPSQRDDLPFVHLH